MGVLEESIGVYGVAIQLEVAKLVKETGKDCKSLLDALPAYHKDRAAALEKVVAKTTTEKSEATSSSTDEEKGSEAAMAEEICSHLQLRPNADTGALVLSVVS